MHLAERQWKSVAPWSILPLQPWYIDGIACVRCCWFSPATTPPRSLVLPARVHGPDTDAILFAHVLGGLSRAVVSVLRWVPLFPPPSMSHRFRYHALVCSLNGSSRTPFWFPRPSLASPILTSSCVVVLLPPIPLPYVPLLLIFRFLFRFYPRLSPNPRERRIPPSASGTGDGEN